VGHREFDVEVLALPGAGLRGQQPAAVDLLEVAVRELVPALPVLVLLVVDPEMPPGVLADPVLLDEVVLLLRRRPVLAPGVTVVDDISARRDQLSCVVCTPSRSV
jgi:hypothetical protein